MHIASPNAGEVIQGFALALKKGIVYDVSSEQSIMIACVCHLCYYWNGNISRQTLIIAPLYSLFPFITHLTCPPTLHPLYRLFLPGSHQHGGHSSHSGRGIYVHVCHQELRCQCGQDRLLRISSSLVKVLC